MEWHNYVFEIENLKDKINEQKLEMNKNKEKVNFYNQQINVTL